MVRVAETTERVRLAPADWGGLCSLALTIVVLACGTLYKMHELSGDSRVRQALLDANNERARREMTLLRAELRGQTQAIQQLQALTDQNGETLLSRGGYLALLKAYQEADQRARVAVYEWLKGFAAKQGYPPPPRPSQVTPPSPPRRR